MRAEDRIGHGHQHRRPPGADRQPLPLLQINRALDFDRQATFGMRLDIPSGTAVRFEPGQEKEVALVEIGGRGRVTGFNSLTEGMIDRPSQGSGDRPRESGRLPGA